MAEQLAKEQEKTDEEASLNENLLSKLEIHEK